MTILGRILLAVVAFALVGETVVAWNVYREAEAQPREPITVGERVERSLRASSPLTEQVNVVLAAPIEAPTPADRMPPPLHASHRKVVQRNEATQSGQSPPARPLPPPPAPSVAADAEKPPEIKPAAPVVVEAPAERPMPPLAPMPRAETPEAAQVAVNTKNSEQAGTEVSETAPPAETPKLETLPDTPEPAKPAPPMPKPAMTVAANVPAPDRTSPFSPPKPENAKPAESPAASPEKPVVAVPPFERPALGPVKVNPDRAADAVRRLTALGAMVSEAIDREGQILPGRYSVSLDPNPNGDVMTKLNLQLQNQLGQALGDLGDSLYGLTLRNLGLGNLFWISRNSDLVMLDLTGSNFLNIEPLTRLPRLETLNVSRTHVDNMVLASMIRNLRVLNLSSAGVVDINPLRNLQGLEELYLNETRVGSIDTVARMPRLTVLDISGTRVTDLRPLANCPSLRRLGLARTRTSDLGFVASCPELVGLDLSGCEQLQGIDALAGAKKLENLSLFGVPVENIDGLSGCDSLQTLELSRTAVNDISPLAKSKRLQELYLRALKLKTPSPLTALPELKLIDLTGTSFEDAQALVIVRKTLSDKGVEVLPEN